MPFSGEDYNAYLLQRRIHNQQVPGAHSQKDIAGLAAMNTPFFLPQLPIPTAGFTSQNERLVRPSAEANRPSFEMDNGLMASPNLPHRDPEVQNMINALMAPRT